MYLWILIAGAGACLYNAWGIGANDCANSFATSVGAKVLTLKQAILIASIFEFSGAFLMGSRVSNTIRKKIVELDDFEDDPGALMLGMFCSNIGAAVWLHIASWLKLPVSTTHSIIGSIVGFALAYGGANGVNWDGVGKIVASWVISPLLAGIFSLLFYTAMKYGVIKSKNPYNRTIMIFPVLTFFTFLLNSFFIIYKGTPQLDLDETSQTTSSLVAIGIGIFMGLLSYLFYVPFIENKIKNNKKVEEIIELEELPPTPNNSSSELERTKSYRVALEGETVIDSDIIELTDSPKDNIKKLKEHITHIRNVERASKTESLHGNASDIDPEIEELCSWLQIITASFSSFAHGANDVANSIAPFATVYSLYQGNSVTKKNDIPIWILFMGGAGIVAGLATWGYKVIDRIGKELTKITASRGFIIEFSAALTTIIASRAEVPVSTTHCQIGSVVGCGVGDGKNNIEWKLVREILLSWLVTLPVCGIITASIFSFAYYSP